MLLTPARASELAFLGVKDDVLDPIISDGGREGAVMKEVKRRKTEFTGAEHIVDMAGGEYKASRKEGDWDVPPDGGAASR